jgi:hypothetical protein
MGGRKTFVTNTVLTAADVQDYLMDQSVMIFANTAARGSAIPSPVTGMTTYLEDTKDLQVFDGSAYSSPFGLTLIKSQSIGSGVPTIVVSDVFSAAYDNYKIIVNGGTGTAAFLGLQLGAVTTGYSQTIISLSYAGVNNNGFTSNVSNFQVAVRSTADFLSGNFELTNPFLTARTFITGMDVTSGAAGVFNGFQNSNTSFTGFTLIANTGNVTGGTITVYGYRKN